MKKLFAPLLALSLVAPVGLRAQEFKAKFPDRQNPKITLEMRGSNVTVEGYDGDEVLIRGNGYEAPPKRAEGLRPLYSAEDNTRMGLSVTTTDGSVVVSQASRKDAAYTIRVPRRTALVFVETSWDGSDLQVSDLTGPIELKLKNGDARLLNVAGPVVANSTSGDVTVRFANGATRPEASSISLISGDLDVTLPNATKATLALRSMSGEIYTDFDLALPKGPENLTRVGGQTVTGNLNGGGAKMALHTISGDIYVRKAK